MKKLKKRKLESFFKHLILLLVITLLVILSSAIIINIKSPNHSFSSKKTTTNINKNIKHQNNTQKNNNKETKFITKKDVNLDKYLFLGDSYTVLLEDTIKKNNPHSIVKAKVGVQPKYWNENFNKLPNKDKINGVILLIGVNGATYKNNIRDTEKLIHSLVNKYKNKQIYVEKVFPVGKMFENANPITFNNSIKNHNKKIKYYCNNYNNVTYIDTTNGLITNDGYLKYTIDGLHIKMNKQKKFYKNIVVSINNSNKK